MIKMTINGKLLEFEAHDAESMIRLAERLEKTTPPAIASVPPAVVQKPTATPSATGTVGRPRKHEQHVTLKNAIRTLEMISTQGRVTMDQLISAFGLKNRMGVSGVSTCTRTATVKIANMPADDAYRVGIEGSEKVWLKTDKTDAVLAKLKLGLEEAMRG